MLTKHKVMGGKVEIGGEKGFINRFSTELWKRS